MDNIDDISLYIKEKFYGEYLEALRESVRIPSLNKVYDPEWKTNRALQRQCEHMAEFARKQEIQRCTVTPLNDEERSPFLVIEVGGSPESKSDKSILIYGHMDKQPFGTGWKTDPCDPVIENGKLYGRGSCDDCYAVYSALLAIKAV